MALTFSVVDTWEDGKRVHVSGTVAATGNYTTGGASPVDRVGPAVSSGHGLDGRAGRL
jgi:hypothetical protein